jgi:hypothetical protein
LFELQSLGQPFYEKSLNVKAKPKKLTNLLTNFCPKKSLIESICLLNIYEFQQNIYKVKTKDFTSSMRNLHFHPGLEKKIKFM